MEKIVIAGAGELGKLLAEILIQEYNVTIIDSNPGEVELEDKVPGVEMVTGSCTDASVIQSVFEDGPVKYFIAVSGNEAENMIACRMAKKMGAEHTVCRLYKTKEKVFPKNDSSDLPMPELGDFGIDYCFSNTDLLVKKMGDVLDEPQLMELFHFLNSEACVANIRITRDCPLHGVSIKDFMRTVKINVNIAAIIKDWKFVIPGGDTIITGGDYIYVAGSENDVNDFIREIYPQQKGKRHIIIVGGGNVPNILASKICKDNQYSISMVVRNASELNKIREMDGGDNINAFIRDPKKLHNLTVEADLKSMDVAVCASNEDSDNLMSAIMTYHIGIQKRIALIHDRFFMESAIRDNNHCAFCESYLFANEILRIMGKTYLRKDAYLQIASGMMMERKITEKSPWPDKKTEEMPKNIKIALIFRDNEVITPKGKTVLSLGDTLVLFAPESMKKDIMKNFPMK